MALRSFRDAHGKTWEVWRTLPRNNAPMDRTLLDKYMASQPSENGVQPGAVRAQFVNGWLTFVSDDERRRLVPVPPDWETADTEALRGYLAQSRANQPARK